MLRGRIPIGWLVWSGLLAWLVLLIALPAARVLAAASVTTADYNNLRDGWDPGEPALSPATVGSSSFGELFSTKVAGQVYAQPLVFDNTVIVTTEKANAYGIDPATGAIVWKRSFGKPFKAKTIHCSDLVPDIGSTSTPVVDAETGTIYLTTRLAIQPGLEGGRWYLQALSATTGEERPGFPVEIEGSPYNTPNVPFNEGYAEQRPALLLLNGVVYMAFASDCDITPYRGIVVGVNGTTGAITTMWSDEPESAGESAQAGIWQSGGGLVSNAPNRIILTSGNGVSPVPAPSGSPPESLSESVVSLAVGESGRIVPTNFFAPSDAPTLDQNDEDFGAGGPVALPGEYFGTGADPRLVVQVGKDGRVFLLDSEDLGGYRQGPGEGNAVLQTLGPYVGVWGHPAAYGGQGGWVYVLESGGGGYLRAYSYGVNGEGLPQLASAGTSPETFGYTSGSPIVTSNGTEAGSALVWVVFREGGRKEHAELRAYEAIPVEGSMRLVWSGKIGTAVKFSVPTAWEGRVFVGTANGRLLAFGASSPPVQATDLGLGAVPVGRSATVTLPLSLTRRLTFTGPLAASGVEGLPGPVTKVTRVKGLTAGPTVLNPSGTAALSAGVIRIAQPALERALPAGAKVPVRVTFTPRHAGPVVATVAIQTSAGTRTVTISGYGTAPGLLMSPEPLEFHTIATAAGGKQLSFTFTNSWSRPERLTGFSLPAGPFTVSGLPAVGTVLAPRQTLTASVLFDPSRAGGYRGRLVLRTDRGSLSIPVSGTAVTGVPRLAVSSTHLDVGDVRVGETRVVTLRVGNSGTVPLTITRAIPPLGEFSALTPLPEGIGLDPKTYLNIRIAFKPTEKGPATGLYHLNSTDGRGPINVILSGTGT